MSVYAGPNIPIDGLDVYNAPNWKKLLYVALTRAKQKVFIKE